jgi:hypothetical protein
MRMFETEPQSNGFPPVKREDETAFKQLLEEVPRGGKLGLDFEFDIEDYKPTIVGLASEREAAGLRWTQEVGDLLVSTAREKELCYVAYSTAGADKPVLDEHAGVLPTIPYWADGMLTHYLNNQGLCKTPAKEKDTGDVGVQGFMNLWTGTSMTRLVQNWKVCRGRRCDGPCPTHDVFGYCAVDAWGGLVTHLDNWDEITKNGITPQFYNDILELADLCYAMEKRGVLVDMDYVERMDADKSLKKEKLFPRRKDEMGNDTKNYEWFNPQSPDQGIEWLQEHGIFVTGADKKSVTQAATRLAAKHGYKKLGEFVEEYTGELKEGETALLNWYLHKSEGKGFAPWFNSRVVGADNIAHPRFILPATSTGRLSSASPNFQNIPAHGWGKLVRKAVIPRPGHKILKCDYGQLELRMCLWYAGVDVANEIKGDAFTWLVGKAPADFENAAKLVEKTARDVAKSVSHAGDYMEGLRLLFPWELEQDFTKRQIEYRTLRPHLKKFGAPFDWYFRGKVVCFTGKNLAERMFHSDGREYQARALDIQDMYFGNFPMLRTWQKEVTDEIEDSRIVRSATGRFVRLFDRDEDDIKFSMSMKGSGTSADFVQEAMLNYWHEGVVPIIQVHDELDFEVYEDASDRQINELLEIMRAPSKKLPGFVCPAKGLVGDNWYEDDMRKVPYEG